MTLNEYQEKAMTTCMDSSRNFAYMFLNLVGEVGEFASKVAKSIRKGKISIIANHISTDLLRFCTMSAEDTANLRKEAGDCLWQLSGLCKVMGWTLEEIAQENLDKLAARKQNGTIDGSGDGVTAEERKEK